ncbi:MAG: nucleotidyltransferase domain-containing protein [Candidatus Cloacimonadota bacterium]|nr:nucleotidyltransferase domain-containing protein [Candidatus Cloacimonadota bacterium]
MINNKQIAEITKTIVDNYHPEKIILFGSYANGNFTRDSDLDLLLIKESNLPRFKRAREVHEFFDPYPIAMDILVYTKREVEKWKNFSHSFINQVFENGIILYERTC